MAEEIKIVASAVGFDQVNKALESTSKTLTQTSEAASQAGKTLGNQLKVGTAQATQSLTNLGRVVQDAPFGFIGIANNLNPLLESFQRLKQESGSTGGALKTLVSGLSGPAGIGIALSVVTAAFTFAEVGLSRWGLAAKKAKEEANKFQEGLRSAEQGALANAFRFQELTKVIRDTTKSERDRNLALAEANTILEPYGKKIDSINVSLAETTRLENSLTESLVNQAIALKIADKIADLTISKREKLNEIKKQELYIDRLTAANAKSAVNSITGQTAGYVQLQDAVQQLNVQKQEQAKIEAQINSLTADYSSKIVTTLKTTKQTGKETETLAQAIAKFEKSLKAIQATGLSLGTPQFEIDKDKIKEFESFLKKIIEKFNVDPKNVVYLGLEARLNQLQYENLLRGIIDKINAQPLKATLPLNLNLKDVKLPKTIKIEKVELPSLEAIQTAADLANLFSGLPTNFFKPFNQETLKEISTQFNQGFENIAEDVAILFGQTLGDALTGQASIGDFFKGIFASLGQNLEALGKFLVKTAIEIEFIQKTLFTNPFLAIAGGIALIAIGRAISNATNRNAFAVGTRYAPGGMALVGERGPEMINLPRGSQVIPAAQTSQMMGGVGGAIEVFGMLRGQDIYFSNKKYGQTYKRTT